MKIFNFLGLILLGSITFSQSNNYMFPINCSKDFFDKYPIVYKYEYGNIDSTYYTLDFVTDNNENKGYFISKGNNKMVTGFHNSDADTVVYEDKLYVFLNPFPDVFLHKYCVEELKTIPCPLAQGGYLIESDEQFFTICVKNDTLGTLVYHYDYNCLYLEGHIKKNKKEGKWLYYNENGILSKVEIYSKDILLETHSIANK